MEEGCAILAGKAHSPVMSCRATCDKRLSGPTRNPFDLARNSGSLRRPARCRAALPPEDRPG
jgi:Asp-tRNA(Asn)/Glu-tRNA(Gln) amidotransferase A subunit family amidase